MSCDPATGRAGKRAFLSITRRTCTSGGRIYVFNFSPIRLSRRDVEHRKMSPPSGCLQLRIREPMTEKNLDRHALETEHDSSMAGHDSGSDMIGSLGVETLPFFSSFFLEYRQNSWRRRPLFDNTDGSVDAELVRISGASYSICSCGIELQQHIGFSESVRS